MAIYAIGDLQGCYSALRKLLDQLKFDPDQDQIWLAGDLVNRGSESLETLRFVRSLGDSAISVMGNHDISLLAIHYGSRKANPSLKKLLQAPDREQLIDWLRHRPLLHYDNRLKWCMVHAGFAPQWDLKTAQACAHEVEKVLQSEQGEDLLKNLFVDTPDRWSTKLMGIDRLRFSVNALTRIRYCYTDGRLEFTEKGEPGTQSKNVMPWFDFPQRVSKKQKLLFGHWSTLGYYQAKNILALDTGCVWQQQLSAARIDDSTLERTSISCKNLA